MGSTSQRVTVNKSLGQKHRVYCARCRHETNHAVVQSVDCEGAEVTGGSDGEAESMDWYTSHQVIQCQGCDTLSFRQVSWSSEARLDVGQDAWDVDERVSLYPPRSAFIRPVKDYHRVPAVLQRLYRETVACFNHDAPTLCAAGLRAILEGICADQRIADGPVAITKADGTTEIQRMSTLVGKITGLGEKGILSQRNAEHLHAHRLLGNDAVHMLNKPSPDELTLALEIIEHTFEALYEVPDKAEKLRAIRAGRLGK